MSLNNWNVELVSAKELEIDESGEKGSVLAICNEYQGKDKDDLSMPVNCYFGKNTINYVKKCLVEKGTPFAVSGRLRLVEVEDKSIEGAKRTFANINVNEFFPGSKKAKEEKPAKKKSK